MREISFQLPLELSPSKLIFSYLLFLLINLFILYLFLVKIGRHVNFLVQYPKQVLEVSFVFRLSSISANFCLLLFFIYVCIFLFPFRVDFLLFFGGKGFW